MMDKELRKEWIIKKINESEDERMINSLYFMLKGYIDTKEREIGNER